ncbi:hypothetical protein EIN_495490 [Entamoeba invadens IP1]|uniref:TLDc domain-containing protein n=1 Tax=Entamoeba invadens IP1 TaxID=370355 RepID=A0A0A1TZQ4_ENTIV|nr:hypothetical protein EIN_495490 [Entamoeba invadens IP1]ELP87094.1 hypothetical protein EIN_495490 [Entamoeba invadens IP1]|eukprot:XP_004253865.1 hypothetical protein EIN_495490 [Entamoeba invadens IP1]
MQTIGTPQYRLLKNSLVLEDDVEDKNAFLFTLGENKGKYPLIEEFKDYAFYCEADDEDLFYICDEAIVISKKGIFGCSCKTNKTLNTPKNAFWEKEKFEPKRITVLQLH